MADGIMVKGIEEGTHYCIDCDNSQKVYVENHKAIIDKLVCREILSVATKEFGDCELVRDGYKKCEHYKPTQKEGS